MVALKKISPDAIPAALEKARCYRYLKEPVEAESICRDVLEIEPDNEAALTTLLLALTDQFGRQLEPHFTEACDAVSRLKSGHCRRYYEGVVSERRAKAHLHRAEPGSGSLAYEWLRRAMRHYEEAIALGSTGSDDAVLRWNACTRLLQRHPELKPGVDRESAEPMLE